MNSHKKTTSFLMKWLNIYNLMSYFKEIYYPNATRLKPVIATSP
jgi:hypothetical protein